MISWVRLEHRLSRRRRVATIVWYSIANSEVRKSSLSQRRSVEWSNMTEIQRYFGGLQSHRRKRSEHVVFEVAKSKCDNCLMQNGVKSFCHADSGTKEVEPQPGDDICLCAFDRLAGDAYPCVHLVRLVFSFNAHNLIKARWTPLQMCEKCNAEGHCYEDAEDVVEGGETYQAKQCKCQVSTREE